MSKVTAVRGMRDYLPEELSYWQFIEQHLRALSASYGYEEVRLPIVESTNLFKRSVGEGTDIVEKEMYTFSDRNGDSLTLRPEGTAGVVRAGIEHSLFYGATPKLWYLGPMFRHERPQKGRYRQFYQFGLEAFGLAKPHVEAEILAFCQRLWNVLGIEQEVELQINCLGTDNSRATYKKQLVNYLKDNIDSLDEDSKNRLETNPLRILDSKNPDLKELINNAPKLSEYLDEESKQHMQELCHCLDKLNIKYKLNPYLVRGLDYYCLTVFEWVTTKLGAQGTICAGGRYDALVSKLGGQTTPAVGMSIGMERLVMMLEQNTNASDNIPTNADVFIILVGDGVFAHGLLMAEEIRGKLPHLKINVNMTGQSLKGQFKKADKSGARLAIIIGDDEVQNNLFTLKWLRERKEQQQVNFMQLTKILEDIE